MQPSSEHAELLTAIRREELALRGLLARSSDTAGYEDPVYRFYHHSFKVFELQSLTEQIVAALKGLLPGRDLDAGFREIVSQGTGKTFSSDMNLDWERHTRPILEAFFHARFFLEMAVRHAGLERAPTTLPSGWAALLCLYRIR